MSIIGIDLGHGVGQDRGAVGVISEETIINAVGELVSKKLIDLGYTIVPTRPYSCISVSDSLFKRYTKSDINNCDWCISIHANASDGQGHGTEIFTYGAKEIPEARNILNNIVALGFANRGIKDGTGLAMVKRPKAKAMLIEICFCDNENDVNIYDSVGAEAFADAIVTGLTGQSINSTKLGWNGDDLKGWWYCTDIDNRYYYKSEWKEIHTEWYYFNDKGYAVANNWQLHKNKWYYLNKECKMVKSKWIWWEDECYYLDSDGAMLVNTTTPDGYKVDLTGAWIK